MPKVVEIQQSRSQSTEKIFLDAPLCNLKASKNENNVFVLEFRDQKSFNKSIDIEKLSKYHRRFTIVGVIW